MTLNAGSPRRAPGRGCAAAGLRDRLAAPPGWVPRTGPLRKGKQTSGRSGHLQVFVGETFSLRPFQSFQWPPNFWSHEPPVAAATWEGACGPRPAPVLAAGKKKSRPGPASLGGRWGWGSDSKAPEWMPKGGLGRAPLCGPPRGRRWGWRPLCCQTGPARAGERPVRSHVSPRHVVRRGQSAACQSLGREKPAPPSVRRSGPPRGLCVHSLS